MASAVSDIPVQNPLVTDFTFQYKLDPQKHEIRLLTIPPSGNQTAPTSASSLEANVDGSSVVATDTDRTIQYVLQKVSLDDSPTYEALSYAWGPELPCSTILVDGQAFVVRENLASVLQHIQRKDRPVCMWVDAICINQRDEKEKTEQVQIMGKIYEKAVETVVWLGPAEDDSDAAIDKIEDIGPKAIEAGILDFHSATDIPNWQKPNVDERLSKLRLSLNALAKAEGLDVFHPALVPFSKRGYWTRVWVLQEFCLSPNLILMCGLRKFDAIKCFAALMFFAFSTWVLTLHLDLEDPTSHLRSGTSNPPSGAPLALFGARRRYRSEKESLLSLIRRACEAHSSIPSLQASDPRDKIYGLLAATADSDKLGILPDYQKSVADVYTDVTRALITSGEIDFLAWCQQSEWLPSWVPDFSTDLLVGRGQDPITGPLFNASGKAKFPGVVTSPHADKHTLGLTGIKIDVITDLRDGWTPTHGTIVDYFKDAQRVLSDVEALCKQSPRLTGESQVSDASMRIPCADQERYGGSKLRASTSLRSQYNDLKSQTGYLFPQGAFSYRSTMDIHHDRKPFLSKEGHVGLAPGNTEREDHICIIFGSTVPYVLRESSEGTYKLIGEAYVYGIMDGEWLDEDREISTFFLV